MDRKSPLDWDEYYLWLAVAAAVRSKDPSSHVGAVVVKGSSIVTGYNGFPAGVDDSDDRWQRPNKYGFVVHAEANALSNARFSTNGSKIYITHCPPCNECTKLIIQHGVLEVICGDRILSESTLEQSDKSFLMLKEAGIPIRVINSEQIYDKVTKIMSGYDFARRISNQAVQERLNNDPSGE